MEIRPIDGNALAEELRSESLDAGFYRAIYEGAARRAQAAPILDYAPVRHGEWIACDWVEYDNHDECVHYPKQGLKCTSCFNVFKKQLLWKRNYCPNCGAKMDGGKEHD